MKKPMKATERNATTVWFPRAFVEEHPTIQYWTELLSELWPLGLVHATFDAETGINLKFNFGGQDAQKQQHLRAIFRSRKIHVGGK